MNPDLSLRCISEVTGKQLVYKMDGVGMTNAFCRHAVRRPTAAPASHVASILASKEEKHYRWFDHGRVRRQRGGLTNEPS